MFDVSILLNTEFQILLYFSLGFILKRKRFITEEIDNFISIFVLDIIMPANIFLSFYDNMSIKAIKAGYKLIIAGIVIATIVYLFGRFIPSELNAQRKKIVNYSILISNGSLIGLPLIQGLCGSVGIFYANIFMIPTRILSYVMGENFFNPEYCTCNIFQVTKKFFTNPVILAMIFGFILNLFHIEFFSGIRFTLNGLSGCMTPIALILVGSTMYDSLKTKSTTMLSVGKMCFFRLLCSPLITYLICLALHLGSIETTAAVLINACPVASTCTIFAKKYKGDTSFASNCVCYSTFCSLLTLCFVCFVLL